MIDQGGVETRGLRGFPLVLEVRVNLSRIEWLTREQNQRLALAHREPESSRGRLFGARTVAKLLVYSLAPRVAPLAEDATAANTDRAEDAADKAEDSAAASDKIADKAEKSADEAKK